ncbi:hypothetical protein GE061_019379 [Apolygus lucorum]|uniref:Uncharacterized protein n=1 Tax=Apolygus lucorum TaxID=248454 RepID=A0A6A4JAC6_APOLU|nr:hypothetical protein GE061_019379 [Apolygus lucorum]
MSCPGELDSALSRLKSFDFKQSGKPEDLLDLIKYLDLLLVTSDGIALLKQQNKNFEIVLPVFTRVIYCGDLNVAKCFFKYFEVVTDIFRSKLPKIKKGEWWKKFELEHLVKSIPKLTEKISSSDESWVEIWSFTANLIVSDTALSTVPLNTLLSISETSFRKGKEHPEILDQAWKCWVALIDAFGRSPKILLPSKTLNLLLKPLLACYSVSKLRITTWVHLIEVKGIPAADETVKQLVESFCKAMFKASGEKAISRHLPGECAEALTKLLSYDKVVEQGLEEIVSVFGACLSSRPAAGSIEKLTCTLIKVINDCEDEGLSFKLWKSLFEQYKSCNESPILSQACQIIFTEVNFQRWVDSGTVDVKDMNELMESSDFRSKVLLRSVTLLSSSSDDESDNPKKKNKKGSPEAIWSSYLEAYLAWWSNQSPPTPKENDKNSPECLSSLRDGNDFKAMLALVLYPIHQNSWNPATSKTWAMACETCHKHRLLQLMIKQIFDTLEGQQSQVAKSIEVLNILFGIDSTFCKGSIKILESLVPRMYSMESKSIMDLLNLCEIAVSSNELTPVIGKILKNVFEIANSESDQLNAHKIRTKAGKISRKVEQFNSEKDKPVKSPRTPFRTQSNFLQRLAKAEEKNKNKNTFLSSMFSPTDKNKNDEKVEDENGISELSPQDTSLENINTKFTDELSTKKSSKLLDDSENVPIIMPLMSPSMLKENLSSLNDEKNEREVIVAEKENVIVPSSTTSLTISSPANKMKITNARELKVVDASSPTMVKKAKPLAGQKVTPKKATPSKVSYFDDDANDCVMVPPKPKTTPLTEHQMEMMTKRRTDIPAMYQDLSQDTQISNGPSAIVQEMTNGVSPMETEDIVQATPSPEPAPSLMTPERSKNASKTNSAKKLDFNSLVSTCKELDGIVSHDPSSSLPLTNDPRSTEELVSTSDQGMTGIMAEANTHATDVEHSERSDHEEQKELVSGTEHCDNKSQVEKLILNDIEQSLNTPKKEKQPGEEKSKRKRKSEPVKFSPKQTRSKKSLNKTITPDAKLSKSSACESSSKCANDRLVCSKEAVEVKKSDQELNEKMNDLPVSTNSVEVLTNDTGNCPPDVASEESVAISLSETDKKSRSISEITEDLESTPTPRKRKCEDALSSEGPKKLKPSDDETPSKKVSSCKKKRKPFKLSSGNNNLENWLVKTERVPNSATSLTTVVKNEENNSEEIMSSDPLAADLPAAVADSIDLNNSEEIVPSTQELDSTSLLDSAKSILSSKIKDELQEQEVVSNGDKVVSNVGNKDDDCEEYKEPCIDGIKEEPIPDLENNTSSPEPSEESSKKNGNSVLQELALESPNDDDVDFIICSPTKRHKRASSVMRGEGDTYLTREKFLSDGLEDVEDESSKRSLRNRGRNSSPSTQSRRSLHAPGGRSARMLRLAASSTLQEEENGVMVTPVRKRENIVPMTYGENWPTGPTEDWVACVPCTPYSSPFRGVLKKTPLRADEGQVTPQRCPQGSFASPLLSSPRRKRVVFLDPPVTKGLIYERDSPFGALHLADVPQGSPYPTWKGHENLPAKLTSLTVPESVPDNSNAVVVNHVDLITSNTVSEEVHKHIDGSSKPEEIPVTKSIVTPSNDLEYRRFKDKYSLEDGFIEQYSQLSLLIRSLIFQCFENSDMEETVDEWKLSDCRKVCGLSHDFLCLVKNERGQSLIDIFKAVNLIPAIVEEKVTASEESQTDPTSVPTSHSTSQTELQTCSVASNTIALDSTDSSTQADQELPTPGEVLPILERLGCRKTLEYCSEYLKILSTVQDMTKRVEVITSVSLRINAVAMAWVTTKLFLEDYPKIKEDIINLSDVDRETNNGDYMNKLQLFKEQIGEKIHSVRQLDAANDLYTLLHLLEKRLLLGWFNVEPLTDVTKIFGMDETNTFNDLMVYRTKLNNFKRSNPQIFTSPPYDPDIFLQVPPNREVLPTKVYETICNLLGSDWRSFGREMVNENYATEGQLDALKRDTRLTNKEATRQLLDLFLNGGDKRSKRSQLSKLFQLIHRNDIDEEMEVMLLDGNM